jgi:hypothetical protein
VKDDQEEPLHKVQLKKKQIVMGAAESTQASVQQEQAYAFIGCLHRVRKMYKIQGFNADFTKKMFGPYILNKLSRSDADIKEAVNLWCSDPAAACSRGAVRTHQQMGCVLCDQHGRAVS